VDTLVPSAVSISADVLSELRTGPAEIEVDDEEAVDDEVAVVDDVVTMLAAVTLGGGASGTGAGAVVGDVLEAGAVFAGSGGGGTGLVVVAAGDVDGVELAEVEPVDDDVELVDVDDVEFVDEVELADDEVVAGGAATGGADAAGALVELLVPVEDVVPVEPDAGAPVDLSVSLPAPPRNTTGVVD
jgi:hypothetical protein